VVLRERGSATGQNSGEPSPEMAGEGAGEDPKLAWCRFMVEVVEERPSAMECGGTRQRRPLVSHLRQDGNQCGSTSDTGSFARRSRRC
jgi:hypothetical protein